MADFHKKAKNPYRKFLINMGALVVMTVLALVVVANVKIYQKKQELNTQVASLQQKVEDLKNQNARIKENMARENDPVYIEKVAREELDLQKPGEKVFSFVPAPGREQVGSQKSGLAAWVGSAWSSFINVFKK